VAIRRGPTALAGGREKRSRSLRQLIANMFRYLGGFKGVITIAAILTLIAMVFRTIDPLILAAGIDLVFQQGTLEGVIFLGVLFVILRVSSWLLGSAYTWLLSGTQGGFIRSLQQDVYRKLVGADLSYHRLIQSGDVTSRVTTDTDNLAAGVQIIIDFGNIRITPNY